MACVAEVVYLKNGRRDFHCVTDLRLRFYRNSFITACIVLDQ